MDRKLNLDKLLNGCSDMSFDDGIRIDAELVPLGNVGGPPLNPRSTKAEITS